MDDVIAGRYQLGVALGHGGMAQVRAAGDLRLHRTVAVKLVDSRTADAAVRRRFFREAGAAASFSDSNAVASSTPGMPMATSTWSWSWWRGAPWPSASPLRGPARR